MTELADPTPRTLLLPGWGTSETRMHPIRDAIRGAGGRADVIGYEPAGSVAGLGIRLAASLPSGPVTLVGHSLGGLVAAAAALSAGDHDVRHVVTINSPWRGTWLGWTGSGSLAEELRWGSDGLDRLRDALAANLRATHGPSWTTIGCLGDLGCTPLTAVGVPSGERLRRQVLPLMGHSTSLLRPAMARAVVRALAETASAADVSASSSGA